MKIPGFTLMLCSIVIIHASAQNQMFEEAFEEFSTSRLWEFEEIPIAWKMEGMLQADLNEGLNSLLENNPGLADATLTTVVEKDSTVWQAYYYRAAARKQLRKFAAARNDMLRALKLHGDFYEGLIELAKILHLDRQTYESERAINKAIRLDRSRGTAYYLKGDINMWQGEIRSAVNNYKDCVAADSLFHDARIKLALLDAVSKKNVNSARAHLDKVLLYDSLQKSALLFRSLLVQETDKRQAIRDLTNLILVSPNNIMALYFRGLHSAALGDYEVAFNDFHKTIKLTAVGDNAFVGKQTWLDKKIDLQNAGAYVLTRVYGLPDNDGQKIKQAYCHLLLGEYDKSIDVLGQVANARKESAAVFLKAVAHEHKGEHIQALQHYTIALVCDDGIAEAYKKRGIYEQELKEWDKSVKDFTTFLKFYPGDYFINRVRGVSYYYMDKFQEALDDFNVYLKNDSTNKEVQGYRGMAYLKTNQRLKAYVDFAVSDNHGALDFKDLESLIDSVLQLKDTVQALYCLDVITKTTPYFTEGYVQKFRIHMARKEWKPVADDITRALRNSRSDVPKSDHSYLLTLQGLSLSRNRHTEDAIKMLSEAIKFDDKNDIAYLERGRLFLTTGKKSKAEDDLQRALALGNLEAKQLLTEIH